MKLVHYSASPLWPIALTERIQQLGDDTDFMKPRGLWVSDDDCEDNWRTWCIAEDFHLECLNYAHDVELNPDADGLILRSAEDIDAFTDEYHFWPYPELAPPHYRSRMWIDWPRVRERYAGLIITPYIWSRRLSLGDTPDAMWYYGWDCASGCIWDTKAIASIKLRENSDGLDGLAGGSDVGPGGG